MTFLTFHRTKNQIKWWKELIKIGKSQSSSKTSKSANQYQSFVCVCVCPRPEWFAIERVCMSIVATLRLLTLLSASKVLNAIQSAQQRLSVPKVPSSIILNLFILFSSSSFPSFFFPLFFVFFIFFANGRAAWFALSAVGASRGQRTVVLCELAVIGVHVRPVDFAGLARHVGQQLH